MPKLTPVILTLSKRGQQDRVMVFESYQDALDTGVAFAPLGWGWRIEAVTIYRQGETPDLPDRQQPLFE